jgi:hypothetical protein
LFAVFHDKSSGNADSWCTTIGEIVADVLKRKDANMNTVSCTTGKHTIPTFALVAALALVGCATPTTVRKSVDPALAAQEAAIQRKLAFERQVNDYAHVQTVARPLLRSSVALCGAHVVPAVGLFAVNAYDFKKGDAQEGARANGLGEVPTVIVVVDHTPASSAGLQVHDKLLAVDGWPVPVGNKASAAAMEHVGNQLKTGHMTLTVDREGQKLDLPMQAETICDYGVTAVPSDAVNAYADGKSVYITRGMLRFVETDQELALVVAHELAHNAMGHIEKKRINASIGSVFDALAAGFGVYTGGAFGKAGAQAYSQAFESEADYVGLYAMARADIPIDGAANFWRRMGVASGGIKTEYGATHPGSAERFVAIENAISEIHAKQAANLALVPNIKGKTVLAAAPASTPAVATGAPNPPSAVPMAPADVAAPPKN